MDDGRNEFYEYMGRLCPTREVISGYSLFHLNIEHNKKDQCISNVKCLFYAWDSVENRGYFYEDNIFNMCVHES